MTKMKIDKATLRQRIQELDIDNELKSQLLDAVSEKKTFGLVWEEKEEEAQERLREELPVFVEDESKRIVNSDDTPNHVIIEGDNLHALTALSYSHEGKFDVIYIDPPYNTGATDWKYNNDYVDKEDEYRHSKWLDMMKHRLVIAKRLLEPSEGIMIVAIDDYEVSHLTILLEEMFKAYDICPVIVNHHPQGGAADNISRTHEYALFVIPKGKKLVKGNKEEDVTDEWSLMRTGTDIRNLREGRPKSFYAIYVNKETYEVEGVGPELSKDDQYDDSTIPNGCFAIYPLSGGIERVWRYTRESMESHIKSGSIICSKNRTLKVIKKKDCKYETVFSVWNGPRYNAGTNGTNLLSSMFGDNRFSYPKSIYTVFDTLKYCLQDKTEAKILDFFAGSGTTLHATMMLNAEDGGNRQCILVSNDESNICEDVTYERNKRVINGYTKPNGEFVEGIHHNNLRFYRTEFVPRNLSTTGQRNLIQASTDLLCIKNDLYDEKEMFGNIRLRKHIARYFDNGKDKMLIIYKVEAIESLVAEMMQMPEDTKIKVYVFSTNNYAMEADFEDVADKVELYAMPAALWNAYKKVLPKKLNTINEEEDNA